MEFLKTLAIGVGIFAGIMVVLAFIPSALGVVLDPLNMRRVKPNAKRPAASCWRLNPGQITTALSCRNKASNTTRNAVLC